MSPDSTRIAAALRDLLQAEASIFTELADLAAVQRHALLEADEDRLLNVAGRAESLAVRFRLLEDERARIESAPGFADGAEFDGAKTALVEALGRLLRETAISNTVFERFGDTLSARQAAVGGMLGSTYLPNGRRQFRPGSGSSLYAEG